MLISFSASNFRSINDKVTLCIERSSTLKDPDDKLIPSPVESVDDLLRTVVIYGLNGTGKSNLLKAFAFVQNMIVYGHRLTQGEEISVEPFLLTIDNVIKPSYFQIVFISEGVKFEYEILVGRKRIVKEQLSAFPKNTRQIWFSREYQVANNEYAWKFGSNFKGERESIKNRTLENALFLSKAAHENHVQVRPLFDFFQRKMTILTDRNSYSNKSRKMVQNPSTKHLIINFLRNLDLGIEDINIKKIALFEDNDRLPDFLPKDARSEISKYTYLEAKTVHAIPGTNDTVLFDLESQESEGTKQAFALAGPIIDVLNTGGLLIVDELESSLHCKLFSYIIDYFNRPEVNKKNAQLIFTTHSPTVVDSMNDPRLGMLVELRRDQVWFTIKKDNGGTILYSLADVIKTSKKFSSARKGQNISKGILEGKFYEPPTLRPHHQLDLF